MEELHRQNCEGAEVLAALGFDRKGYPAVGWARVAEVGYVGMRPVYEVEASDGKRVRVAIDGQIRRSTTSTEGRPCVYSVYKELEGEPLGLDEDFLAFIGLWLADGSRQRDGGDIRGVAIAVGYGPGGMDRGLIDFLDRVARRYGRRLYCYRPKGNCFIYVSPGRQDASPRPGAPLGLPY